MERAHCFRNCTRRAGQHSSRWSSLTAIAHLQPQPLTADWQPLTADWQPLTADWQPLTADWQPLTAEWQPLTADCQPSLVHSARSI